MLVIFIYLFFIFLSANFVFNKCYFEIICIYRKLGELGYRRSGESCKQKFEEESRHFDNMSTSSYTMKSHYTRPFFSELEEFCHGENSSQVLVERNQNVVQKLPSEEGEVENVEQQQISLVQDSRNEVLRVSLAYQLSFCCLLYFYRILTRLDKRNLKYKII